MNLKRSTKANIDNKVIKTRKVTAYIDNFIQSLGSSVTGPSPIFITTILQFDQIQYEWFNSGYLDEMPDKFLTPLKYCFPDNVDE